jgi:hypothetical protein
LKDVAKIALATTAAVAPTYVVRLVLINQRPIVVLAGTGAVFGLTYLCGLLVLRVPSAAERELFWRKLAAFTGRPVSKSAADPVT